MLRERIVAGLGWLFTRLALIAAPKPDVPPDRWFIVGTGPMTATLLFVPCPVGEWHVVSVIEHPGEKPWMGDSAVGRCWAWPLRSGADVERVIAAMEPEFVVTLRCDPKGHSTHSSIGPTTCVTLAKRMIGLHNPGIVTSRQLLSKLWELHNGCAERRS